MVSSQRQGNPRSSAHFKRRAVWKTTRCACAGLPLPPPSAFRSEAEKWGFEPNDKFGSNSSTTALRYRKSFKRVGLHGSFLVSEINVYIIQTVSFLNSSLHYMWLYDNRSDMANHPSVLLASSSLCSRNVQIHTLICHIIHTYGLISNIYRHISIYIALQSTENNCWQVNDSCSLDLVELLDNLFWGFKGGAGF